MHSHILLLDDLFKTNPDYEQMVWIQITIEKPVVYNVQVIYGYGTSNKFEIQIEWFCNITHELKFLKNNFLLLNVLSD